MGHKGWSGSILSVDDLVLTSNARQGFSFHLNGNIEMHDAAVDFRMCMLS